jgi:hypothetical protein
VFREVAAFDYASAWIGSSCSPVSLSNFSRSGNSFTFTVEEDTQLAILYLYDKAAIYVSAGYGDYSDWSGASGGGTNPDVTGEYSPGATVQVAAVADVTGFRFVSWTFDKPWGPNGASSGTTSSFSLSVPSAGDSDSYLADIFGPSAVYGMFDRGSYVLTIYYQAVITISVNMKTYAGHGVIKYNLHGSGFIEDGVQIQGTTEVDLPYDCYLYIYAVASAGFYVYGAVRTDSGTRNVLYSYPSSGGGRDYYRVLLRKNGNFGRNIHPGDTFALDVWFWPDETGKILYRQSDGAIIYGPGGKPMAQFVDT